MGTVCVGVGVVWWGVCTFSNLDINATRMGLSLYFDFTVRRSSMGNQQDKQLPCTEFMKSYVKCMEDHEGVRPDPYEPEWCDQEKTSYLDCMNHLRTKQHSNTTKKG